MDLYAWLILRIVYAWMFLSPIPNLVRNWSGTKDLTRLLIPRFATSFFTVVMLCVMFFGALAILFGVFGQIAGLALMIYSLLGAIVHYRLAEKAQKISLSSSAALEDKQQLTNAIRLAVIGNITSAHKNYVLAAVACFFMLMGTGPFSLVSMNVINVVKNIIGLGV